MWWVFLSFAFLLRTFEIIEQNDLWVGVIMNKMVL